MDDTKKKKEVYFQTAGYLGAFVVLGMVVASLGPTLPWLAENTGTQLSGISFLFTARSFGYMLGAVLGGRLYDRVRGHPVMASALAVIALMMALIPLISTVWLLAVVMLVLGTTEGTLDVGGNTLMVWVHRDKVGPFMNGLHFFFGVGAFLSPILIANAMLVSGGIGGAYGALALLMLPVVAWLMRLPSPLTLPSPKQRNQDAANTLAGSIREVEIADQRLLVFLIGLFFFFYVGAEVSFGGWIFTYAVTLNPSDNLSATYLTSAFWGALTLGRLLSIPIAIRFKPFSILLGDLIGCLVSVGVILMWSNSWNAIWLGAVGLGFAMASIFPTTLALAGQRMKLTGRVTGWFFVGASAGGMSLPLLIGQLFEPIGPGVMILLIMFDLILAFGVLAALALYMGVGGCRKWNTNRL